MTLINNTCNNELLIKTVEFSRESMPEIYIDILLSEDPDSLLSEDNDVYLLAKLSLFSLKIPNLNFQSAQLV
jgi:hypothetical protein